MKEQAAPTRLERANKKVELIKNFHSHLMLYVVMNPFLLAFKGDMLRFIIDRTDVADLGFMEWLDWNIISIPIIWGMVLAVQGIHVFGVPAIRKWEQGMLQKYIQDAQNDFKTKQQ